MKNVTVTFSIPQDVNDLLHSVVKKRGLSQFVTKAIRSALEEEQEQLRLAYEMANNDPDRQQTIDEWKFLDAEGWGD